MKLDHRWSVVTIRALLLLYLENTHATERTISILIDRSDGMQYILHFAY